MIAGVPEVFNGRCGACIYWQQRIGLEKYRGVCQYTGKRPTEVPTAWPKIQYDSGCDRWIGNEDAGYGL